MATLIRAERQPCRRETKAASPDARYMPAIIRFLGYNPLPAAKCWGERLVRDRTSLRLSQKGAAERLGIDPSTLARWERGERELEGAFAARAERFLAVPELTTSGAAARTA